MATLTIESNGLPNPAQFGKAFGNNAFAPSANTATSQSYNYSFTFRGGENTTNAQLTTPLSPLGIMTNGVVFYSPSSGVGVVPPALDAVADAPGTGFEYNAVQYRSNSGGDDAGGWPESNGQYHYMSSLFLFLPTGTAEASAAWNTNMITVDASPTPAYYNGSNFSGDLFRHADGHSKIVGYAFDGYPIYGPYAYSDFNDPASVVTRMTSSYQLYSSERPGRGFLYSEKTAGKFINDHEYQVGTGTLDEYNGRFAKTPEYPLGTYAYHLSVDASLQPVYPYIVGPSTKQQRAF
jgi:hypothetical protein